MIFNLDRSGNLNLNTITTNTVTTSSCYVNGNLNVSGNIIYPNRNTYNTSYLAFVSTASFVGNSYQLVNYINSYCVDGSSQSGSSPSLTFEGQTINNLEQFYIQTVNGNGNAYNILVYVNSNEFVFTASGSCMIHGTRLLQNSTYLFTYYINGVTHNPWDIDYVAGNNSWTAQLISNNYITIPNTGVLGIYTQPSSMVCNMILNSNLIDGSFTSIVDLNGNGSQSKIMINQSSTSTIMNGMSQLLNTNYYRLIMVYAGGSIGGNVYYLSKQ